MAIGFRHQDTYIASLEFGAVLFLRHVNALLSRIQYASVHQQHAVQLSVSFEVLRLFHTACVIMTIRFILTS
jgi:hypothetical protein